MLLLLLLIFSLFIAKVSGQTCDIKFEKYVSDHSLCLMRSTNLRKSGLSSAAGSEILTAHNLYRSTAAQSGYNGSMPASNMQKMYWDEELAQIAQAWANQCIWAHEDDSRKRAVPGKYSVGQNLYTTTAALSGGTPQQIAGAVHSWVAGELQYFTFGGPATGMVGHLTQALWDDSALIGCGLSECSNIAGLSKNFRTIVACNYAKVGNTVSRIYSPYSHSSSCADCSSTCDSQKLCDCQGKVCYNGGTLDLNTCQCNCLPQTWLQGPNCDLICGTATDRPGFCTPNSCLFSNVPYQYCPVACNLCPYADAGATTRGAGTATTTSSGAVLSTTTSDATLPRSVFTIAAAAVSCLYV